MSDLVLTRTRIRGGVYEGVLTISGTRKDQPHLSAIHQNSAIGDLELSPDPELDGAFAVRFSLPSNLLTDGSQTILINDTKSGETLDSFSVVTGAVEDDDLRGEVDLLRAELDMLKKAFRRHCLETGGN